MARATGRKSPFNFWVIILLLTISIITIMVFSIRDGMTSSSVAPNNAIIQSETDRIGAIYLKKSTKEDPNSESTKNVKKVYDDLKAAKNSTDDKNGELLAKSKLIIS